MYLSGTGVTLANISTCSITDNQAAADGGAFFLDGRASILVNNSFSSNRAVRGGAVAYSKQCFAKAGILRLTNHWTVQVLSVLGCRAWHSSKHADI